MWETAETRDSTAAARLGGSWRWAVWAYCGWRELCTIALHSEGGLHKVSMLFDEVIEFNASGQ